MTENPPFVVNFKDCGVSEDLFSRDRNFSDHQYNIMLQIKSYGGNLERSGTIMLLGYIGALFTIPACVAIWEVMR